MQPWLSVVMPTFNGGRFLRTALNSIVVQNDPHGCYGQLATRAEETLADKPPVAPPPIEVIAVDDGSTDDTLDILREYSARVPLSIVSRPHSGNWVAGTNAGLIRASGEWVCFLHQDDGWLPNRLQRLHALTESFRDVVMFLHASRYVDSEGTCVGTWKCALPRLGRPLPPDRVLERLLVQNFISIPAPIFRREAAVRIGGMNERLWYTADWDFWLSLAGQGNVYHHPEALSWFRIHPMSQTVQAGRSATDFRQQLLEVLDRHLAAFATRWPGRCAR